MSSKKKRKPLAEINVVPYIDVMLVLLVVFMVTAPLLMQGVKVELPKTASQVMNTDDDEPIIVSIDQNGAYYINLGKEPKQSKPLKDVTSMVTKILADKPQTPVLVWGDTKVEYGLIVSLMSDLQTAGAPGVGLVTEPFERR